MIGRLLVTRFHAFHSSWLRAVAVWSAGRTHARVVLHVQEDAAAVETFGDRLLSVWIGRHR